MKSETLRFSQVLRRGQPACPVSPGLSFRDPQATGRFLRLEQSAARSSSPARCRGMKRPAGNSFVTWETKPLFSFRWGSSMEARAYGSTFSRLPLMSSIPLKPISRNTFGPDVSGFQDSGTGPLPQPRLNPHSFPLRFTGSFSLLPFSLPFLPSRHQESGSESRQ